MCEQNRRVSFANPIYKEELADDIDRRSPVLRIHPYNNGSQSLRNVKSSPSDQAKVVLSLFLVCCFFVFVF